MEFFEKAHVNREHIKQKNKTEQKLKKQLKQMIYGYKNGNNQAIKNSENIEDFEDSSSVSGVSDLNLTNSSNDGHTHEEISSNIDKVSITGVNDLMNVIVEKQSIDNLSLDSECNDSKTDTSTESISAYVDSMSSLSEDLHSEINENELLSSTEDGIFLTDSLETTTNLESDDSQPFDAEGILATKILEKIRKKENIRKGNKKGKKRKISEINYTSSEVLGFKNKLENYEIGHLETKQNKLHIGEESSGPSIIDDEDIVILDSKLSSSDTNIDSVDSSPPFVSIKATKMPDQSLSEIIGDYKYPTIRNIPHDSSHNIILSLNNSDEFSAESMGVENAYKEEGYDTTTSNIDHDVDMDVSNMDTTNVDTSDGNTNTFNNQSINSVASISSEDSNHDLKPVNIFYGEKFCIFVLKHPVEIFLHGKVKVVVLAGSVEIFGYKLKQKSYDVYAPYYNYSQCLRTVENQNAHYGLFGKLTSIGLTVAEAEQVVTTLNEHDAVIRLNPLTNRKIEFVENNFSVLDLFAKTSRKIENMFVKASDILGCSLYPSKPTKYLQENTSWRKVLQCGSSKRSRGIVCGGKGVGKSTFLRYYVNRMLEQGPVLVIDLDPGQCEFTVAGNVSATVVTEPLLGPNFTHLKIPDKSLNIGMINTMDNPKRYATAVEDLIAYCRANKQFQDMPCIINTMGMTNSLGVKFMLLIILQSQPTFLFQLDNRKTKKTFDSSFNVQTVKRLFSKYENDRLFTNIQYPDHLEYSFFTTKDKKTSHNNLSLTPRDERYLNFLAYFGELVHIHNGQDFLSITPYQVPLHQLYVGINVKVKEDEITKVINGKVIALCQNTQDEVAKVFTLADKPLLCHGHGLIRGINYEKQLLYIVTPTPVQKLPLVNTLVYADWVPELRLEDKLPEGITVPYRSASLSEQKELMSAPRRRFNPLQLLNMTKVIKGN